MNQIFVAGYLLVDEVRCWADERTIARRIDRSPRPTSAGFSVGYALDALRDCQMCEVGVKENQGQRTLTLRPLVRSNSNVGYAGCNRSIQAWR